MSGYKYSEVPDGTRGHTTWDPATGMGLPPRRPNRSSPRVSLEQKYGWTAAGLVAVIVLGWVILLLAPAGRSVGERSTGRVSEDRAYDLQLQGYDCFYLDRNSNGEQDYAETGNPLEPTTYCKPPKLFHRPLAVWTMITVGMILFAFAGTFTRLARGGNPWAGFILGGLLGVVGLVAAVVVPVPSRTTGAGGTMPEGQTHRARPLEPAEKKGHEA